MFVCFPISEFLHQARVDGLGPPQEGGGPREKEGWWDSVFVKEDGGKNNESSSKGNEKKAGFILQDNYFCLSIKLGKVGIRFLWSNKGRGN